MAIQLYGKLMAWGLKKVKGKNLQMHGRWTYFFNCELYAEKFSLQVYY